MLLAAFLQPTGPVAVTVLVDKLLAARPSAVDSVYQAQLIAAAKLNSPANRIDTLGLAFDALLPKHIEPAHASSPAAQLLDMVFPLVVVALTVVILVWVGILLYTAGARRGALTLRAEAAEKRETALLAKQDDLRALVFERDRLFQEYVLMLQPLVTDEQYKEWNRATWKRFVRNSLSMTKLMRPLSYHNLRARIRGNSPSFGQHLPTLAAQAWLRVEPAELLSPFADFEEFAEPVASPLDIVSEQESVLQADDVCSLLRELQVGNEAVVLASVRALFSTEPVALPAPVPVLNPAETFLADLLAEKSNSTEEAI